MESYILMGACFAVWLATFVAFRFLMEDPEQATIFGSLAGLVLAVAAAGVYFAHIASCQTCI